MNIMFVCHGNICRSPMGELIMKDLLEKQGIAQFHTVASRAVSREEIGNSVYPDARRELAKHGISCEGKYAAQLQRSDYDKFDLFLLMDTDNLIRINRIFPVDPLNKIHLLLEYAGRPGAEVADPWFTERFDKAYADILSGCEGVLRYLMDDRFAG